MIDLTLDSLTVPGIPDYTPPFGTQKEPLVSLSTVETNNNMIKPFTAQRAIEFSHDETLSRIERNAVLVYTGNADAVLDMSSVTTFKGNEIKIVNTTNHALTVKYLEVGEESYSTMNLTENSVTLTADSTTTYSVKVSVESESITTLWSGTKEQFDAIPVKDSSTLYNIIDDVDEELIQDDKISPNSTWSSEKIVRSNNWLVGKTINFLGDSITKGSWYLNGEWQGYMDNPYPSVIASILGCTSNNFGESGTPIIHNSNNTGFVDRVSSLPAADMNIMFGGVNDLTGGTLGTEDSTDINTIYGALKVIAQTFIDKNPESMNVFISPLMSDITGGAIKYDEMRKAIKYVANLYGFIFIDASTEAPMMNPNVPKLNDTWLNGNLVHPNPEYHKILGRWLANKLISLDSSGSIASNVTSVGCKYLPEMRSSGHTYLKIRWDKLSSSSELELKLILSYGGELSITGNPYYDKSYNKVNTTTTSIKVFLTDSSNWDSHFFDMIKNVYIVENAIYIKFSGALAFTPVILGCVDSFGVTLAWDDEWTGVLASTDRELMIKKVPAAFDIGEVDGATLKEALTNLSIVVFNKMNVPPNVPCIMYSYYKGDSLLILGTISDTGVYLLNVTYKDGIYRIVYKPNVFRNIYKSTETEL